MNRASLDLRPGQYRWAICDRCRGNGQVDHPAFSNGITSDEWGEWGDDEREGYLSGRYDVPCPARCHNGKVQEPLPGRLTFGQLRELVKLRRHETWQEEARREQERESRMLGEW